MSRPESKRKRVCISDLPPERKKAAWEYIRAERPDLEELLTDPVFQELQRCFPGSRVIVEI